MKKTKGAPAPDKTNRVLVNVILDRSGSMQRTAAGTISGYNEYINGLRADKGSEYSVSLTQFDAPMAAPALTVTYLDKPLAEVPELTEADYQPRGNTPLYDAIGECVRRVNAKGRAVITVIITDGHENASQEFTKDGVKALIQEKEKQGWTFAFLGANIDSYAVGGSVGVRSANTANYVPGNEQALYLALAQSTVERATLSARIGVKAASLRSFVTDEQRSSLVSPAPGGGQPQGAGFPRPRRTAQHGGTDPQKAVERRSWAVESTVSGS
jgi:hypothetical protein